VPTICDYVEREEEKSMCTTRQTLLEIYHPTFRKAYQEGRQHYFRESIVLTDKHLVEFLQGIFEDSKEVNAEESETVLYYSTGHLMGQVSGGVIPHQPHEDTTREQQEAFLAKVMHEHEATGPALIEKIRQHWAIQDQLARTLDADLFELVLSRGVDRKSLLGKSRM
jgi:hypothetical protein